MSGTEIFDFRKYTVNQDKEPKENYIYTKEMKKSLLDMKLAPALHSNFFIPRLINEKAKNILEPFSKGCLVIEVKFQ